MKQKQDGPYVSDSQMYDRVFDAEGPHGLGKFDKAPWKPLRWKDINPKMRGIISFDMMESVPHDHSAPDNLEGLELAYYCVKLGADPMHRSGKTVAGGLDENTFLRVVSSSVENLLRSRRETAYAVADTPVKEAVRAKVIVDLALLYRYSKGLGLGLEAPPGDVELIEGEIIRLEKDKGRNTHDLMLYYVCMDEMEAPHGFQKRIDPKSILAGLNDRLEGVRTDRSPHRGQIIADILFSSTVLGLGMKPTEKDWEAMREGLDLAGSNTRKYLRQAYEMNVVAEGTG